MDAQEGTPLPASVPRGAPPQPGPASRKVWWARTSAVVVLFIGVSLSVVVAVAWHGHVRSQAQDSFTSSASSATAALATELRRDSDFVQIQKAASTAIPNLTNKELSAWYAGIEVQRRYPGSIGFGFFQLVPATDLPSFAAAVTADPPTGRPVTPPYTVTPPGARPFYCLQRFGYTTAGATIVFPVTFDLCSPEFPGIGANPIPPLFARATDSGETSVLVGGSLPKVSGLQGVFFMFAPVYSSGAVPMSLQGRQASLVGWLAGTFSGNALVEAAVTGHSDLSVAVRYDQPGGGQVTVASTGSTPAGPVFVQASTIHADGSWNVHVVGSATTTATGQAVVVGGLGVVVSVLLFLLFLLMTRSREQALRMVEDRTRQLRHLALHDALTDLPNRALILDRAEGMLQRARRRPRAIGALFVDVDNFKDINDSFGHDAGDDLLHGVADRLTGALRASDTVGRLGGDEFVVLAEGDIDDGGPEVVAERVMTVLGEPFHLATVEAVEVTVNVSIGVALDGRDSAGALLHDADVALYQAKALGKNRVVVFRPEMQVAVAERLELELDLHRALDEGQLRLLYQPIVDLDTMSVAGVEALLRWAHPTRGLLLPETFLPIAEETGSIIPIGRFVMETACAQTAAWHAAGYPIVVSVNVSSRQLEDEGFVEDVRVALERSGLGPGYLTLEIGEPVLMRNTDVIAARLDALKTVGVRIAVDAFGTGYASLAYLHRFPVDALKLERSFTSLLAVPTESGKLIESLVQLGRSLDIQTLAGGIEDGSQLEGARRAHCDLGQGFLFSRPLDAAAIETVFARSTIRPPRLSEGDGGAATSGS